LKRIFLTCFEIPIPENMFSKALYVVQKIHYEMNFIFCGSHFMKLKRVIS